MMTMMTGTGTDERDAALQSVETQVIELFSKARTMFAAFADRFHPGMLPASYKLFTSIVRLGPITASALAERMLTDKAQISRMVRELEALGFVERTPDPSDGRASLLTATEAGRDRLKHARGPQEHRLAESLEAWDVEQIEALATLLRALNTGSKPTL